VATEWSPIERRARRPRIRALWLVASVTLLVATATAVLVERGTSSKDTQTARPDLQQIIDRLVTGPGRIAPGVSAYASGPSGTWSGSAGVANVETSEPMRPDARVRLESVSKLWLATLVLQLVADGRLRLDDNVERWLPGVLPYGRRITVRQLLNHTSGMVDSNDITHDPMRYIRALKDPALRTRIEHVARRVEKDPAYRFSPQLWIDFAAGLPLEYPPDTAFHYSNIGYLVVGAIAERAGGADLARLFRKRIIDPLHLTSTAYDPAAHISGDHARGYSVARDGQLTDTTTWTRGLGADGGIVSNAPDEARFLQALMQGRILGPAQLAALEQTSAHSTYALGVGLGASECAGVGYGHNGGGDGFETNVFVSSDGARVAVLLLNGRTADNHGDGVAEDAMKHLFCGV
jgi:D-alanyl-D-alanine carboxypeptidase